MLSTYTYKTKPIYLWWKEAKFHSHLWRPQFAPKTKNLVSFAILIRITQSKAWQLRATLKISKWIKSLWSQECKTHFGRRKGFSRTRDCEDLWRWNTPTYTPDTNKMFFVTLIFRRQHHSFSVIVFLRTSTSSNIQNVVLYSFSYSTPLQELLAGNEPRILKTQAPMINATALVHQLKSSKMKNPKCVPE